MAGVPNGPWRVYKFGGSSLQHAAAFRQVAQIVLAQKKKQPGTRLAVVVSAMGGKPKVTDMLLDSVSVAERQDEASLGSCPPSVAANCAGCRAALRLAFSRSAAVKLLRSHVSGKLLQLGQAAPPIGHRIFQLQSWL